MLKLQRHYESYGASVRASLPDTYDAFAKATPTEVPERFPTIFDFLAYAASHVKSAIDLGDEAHYQHTLKVHQKALLHMCLTMVERELALLGEPSSESLMKLLNGKGYLWYRYCPLSVTFDMRRPDGTPRSVAILPRYDEALVARVPEGCEYMDGEEAEAIRKAQDPVFADALFAAKRGTAEGHWKLLPSDAPSISPHAQVVIAPWQTFNAGLVRDWTLPLFPEVTRG